MITIKINYDDRDSMWTIKEKVNSALAEHDIIIEYNYNRSYMTAERARDVRLDCSIMQG